MEIVGEFLSIDTDKGIWNYFRGHWQELFPQIKSRSAFVRQAANLWCYKQQLQQLLAQKLGGLKDPVHLIDGLPIPLCHYQRAKNCRLFSAEANFSYCAAKNEKYYGFRGHLVISLVLCQLINDELLEYNLDKVRSPKIDAQEIYC